MSEEHCVGAYDVRGHSGVEGYPTQSVFAAEAILHQDFNPWTLENGEIRVNHGFYHTRTC